MVKAPLKLFHDVRLARTEIPGPCQQFLKRKYVHVDAISTMSFISTSPSAAAVFVDEFQLHGTYLE